MCLHGVCTVPPTPTPTPTTCTAPPSTPNNVRVVYDALANTATVSWDSSQGATSYNVYRKFDDSQLGSITMRKD